ncbi:hypothetical protein [Actinomadura sp. 21ATH]|uniref:hypothetical protein n=1 Tax=Actinomadura sp. 21ATH TaxID=1735444 RepID=UPI0035C08008
MSIPTGPIDNPPPFGEMPTGAEVAHALDGVVLGDWDVAIVDWLARQDAPVAVTVCSLLERARAAGPHQADGGRA